VTPTRVLAWLVGVAVWLAAAHALAAPKLRTRIQPETVEVGDVATLTVTVTPGDGVNQADPGSLPAGCTVVGRSISPTFQMTIINGQVTQGVVANVTFQIRCMQTGDFGLGPPTIGISGSRVTGGRVALHVVPKGSLPPRAPDPFDPFGFFSGGNPIGQLGEPILPTEPDYPIDPRYSLDHPRDSQLFLHATVDKTQAVVGEQVTLSVLVYADVKMADPELADPHEVGTSEFLRQSLLKPDANIERVAFARVNGRVYAVAILRKYALFPLHAGELTITPMRVSVGRGGERAIDALKIRVTEPPLDHRPPGYKMGDVGRFFLTADVAPRNVQRGGAVAVNVELSGQGNLPAALTVPTRPGVTWLDPDVKEDLHVLDAKSIGASDVWGGSRRFAYVVQPTQEGDLDLGEIAVPFYDPQSKSYDVAKASLGVIHVTPGAAAPAADDIKLLPNLPQVRTSLGGTRHAEARWADGNAFWALLGMPALAFVFAATGRRAKQSLEQRARQRRESPVADLKQRLRVLGEADLGSDARAIDGATIRVLESAAVAYANVNVRGVGGEAVTSVLTRAGTSAAIADELRDLLEACAAARFSPDGGELEEARKRSKRARALCDKLQKQAVKASQKDASPDSLPESGPVSQEESSEE